MSLSPAILAVALAMVLGGSPEPVEIPRPTEYEVKAAFIYNFAKFVKWPDEDKLGATFVVAVLGHDPFGDVLDKTFDGKTVLDRRIEVRRISTAAEADGVQILFVGISEREHWAQMVKTLEGASVLTVGEFESFTDRGGMIGFILKRDTVRFDINLDQVERASLKMSSQLIRLARHVKSRASGS